MKRYYYYTYEKKSEVNNLVCIFKIDTNSPEYEFLTKTLAINFVKKDLPEERFAIGYDPNTEKFSLFQLTATDFIKNFHTADAARIYLSNATSLADKFGTEYYLKNAADYVTCIVD